MRRLQLFEWEDLAWFPASIREGMQDYLRLVGKLTPQMYRSFARRLEQALLAGDGRHLVDLCSGAGGPLPAIMQAIHAKGELALTATLTDLFPHALAFDRLAAASGGAIRAWPEPVDATAVPPDLQGFRLIANAFHHLPPAAATGVLADAVRRREGIAVFELVGRQPRAFLAVLLGVLLLLILTPFQRPWRAKRWFWTYLLPAIPAASLWDGWVSCLRVYSKTEMAEMIAAVDDGSYCWELGTIPLDGLPLSGSYLIGYPRA